MFFPLTVCKYRQFKIQVIGGRVLPAGKVDTSLNCVPPRRVASVGDGVSK